MCLGWVLEINLITEGDVLLCDALFFFKRERTNRSTGTECGYQCAYLPLSTDEVEGFDQECSAAIRRLCIWHQRRAVRDYGLGMCLHHLLDFTTTLPPLAMPFCAKESGAE